MKKALAALAFGAFGFSMSEYAMVGILTEAAHGLHVGIAPAGHFLSAYALGVVAGALAWATLCRNQPPKKMLIWLVVFFALGNLLTAGAEQYRDMLVIRFLAGLPQGAFFGLGSVVAEQLAPQGRRAGAVAALFAGATVANIVGVPLGIWAGHLVSWRLTYALIGLCGVAAFWLLWKWMPALPPAAVTPLKSEISFLKRAAPWILLLGIAVGNGGIFCWLSYISPLMLHVSGLPAQYMTFVMMLAGIGMFAGNWLSGKLTERFRPSAVAAGFQAAGCVILLFIFFFSGNVWLSLVWTFLGSGMMFALSVPEQMLLIQNAPGGALLGAAVAQAGFYLGNTLGALGGGIPIQMGFGYQYTALAGVILGLIGLFFLLFFFKKYKPVPSQ